MNTLLIEVISGAPRQQFTRVHTGTPEYTILCAQSPKPEDRIALLMKRFGTSTETSAAQSMSYLLQTCVTASVPPDEAELMVETLVEFAKEHPTWTDAIQWICAIIHYYCTDELTVSIFSEFDVPSLAVQALKDNQQNSQLVLAACALISHFNLYPIGDGITQLARALRIHYADPLVSKVACRALAEFTSYVAEAPDRFAVANKEFIDENGVEVLEMILREHVGDEETTTYAARVTANVTSSGVPSSLGPESKIVSYIMEAMGRYTHSEMLCSHALHTLSNFPTTTFIDWGCVSTLFKTTESEVVILEAINFLSSVAMNVKDHKQKMHETGCVQRVLEVMRKYPSVASIQESACSLLSYLSFDSEPITASITEMDGLVLVLDAMKNFPDNEELLVSACAALSGLTFNNSPGQDVVVERKGVSRILDAMRRGKKARLHENGCLAIGTVCWNSDLKADVVRLGGVEVIIKSLSEFYTSSGLVKNACRALAQIAFNCETYRDEMSASGAIPLIIKGMAHHPHYDRVQMHGCVALSYFSWNNEVNSRQITSNNGYSVIVDAMRNHPNNHEVQEHACRALANISDAPAEEVSGALEYIVAAMRRHHIVSEVQEEACRAIVTLSLISPSYKDKLFELNSAECVVAAMRTFPTTQVVQQEACNALAHLAYEHAKLNKAVTDLNGVSMFLAAMNTFVNSPKVQLNACGGLSALAFDNVVAQQQIYDLDGVACIIRAMENFERLRMLELGCSVLGTLAWNTDIKEKVALVAVPEILKAMRTHQNSPILQKSTCRAISQFAFNSENNRQFLAESGAIALIVNAMRSHTSADKLLVHAIKALTYLCWENTQVAEAIIKEGIEDVLQTIVSTYSPSQRVYSEAVHLFKILFRKVSGSLSPCANSFSPPMASPLPMTHTPGPSANRGNDNALLMLSPPPKDDGDVHHFYTAPEEFTRYSARPHRNQRTYAERGDDAGHDFNQGKEERGGDGGGRRRRNRRRGGGGNMNNNQNNNHGSYERRPNQSDAQGEAVRHVDPHGGRPHRRQESEVTRTNRSDDLWDDPDPSTYHGNRQLGNLNWQQAELARQESERQRQPRGPGGDGQSHGGRGRKNPNARGRGRGHERAR